MQWHEFIFSEERKHKLMRHFAFWASWWLYFILCYFLFQQPISGSDIKPLFLTPGDHPLLKTFLLVLLYAIACYPLIYFILPEIIKGKWLKATAYFILLCSFLFIASDLLYWNIFSSIDSLLGSSKTIPAVSRSWPAINLGLMNFAKVAAAATIIKYIKYWWLKQKESQRLEKEKINAELQLLKAQVHPDFLFKTLNNIYTHAQSSSPRTSGMLMKLSDLLSYMLYECDQSQVSLEREIAMMKEYMQLEKIRYNDQPEMEVNIRGDLDGKMIAPFLLLPFIETSFSYCGQMTEHFWINLDIIIEENSFSMKLANGIMQESNDATMLSTNGLANVQKRLALLYPHEHELKITHEHEMLIVFLKIQLTGLSIAEAEKDETSVAIESIVTQPTIYAPHS